MKITLKPVAAFTIYTICLFTASCAQNNITGVIYLGPERMSFHECQAEDQAWLGDKSFQAKGWDEVQQALDAQPYCGLRTMPCTLQSVAVTGKAKFSTGDDGYGHLEQYSSEIIFSAIKISEKQDVCK